MWQNFILFDSDMIFLSKDSRNLKLQKQYCEYSSLIQLNWDRKEKQRQRDISAEFFFSDLSYACWVLINWLIDWLIDWLIYFSSA